MGYYSLRSWNQSREQSASCKSTISSNEDNCGRQRKWSAKERTRQVQCQCQDERCRPERATIQFAYLLAAYDPLGSARRP